MSTAREGGWVERYRALRAQGLSLKEAVQRMNEQSPERPERDNPRFVGPHAERAHDQDE